MRFNRKILKIKSKFYYYTLLVIGSASVLFFVRCSNQNFKEKFNQLRDSVDKATVLQDSIKKADSVSSAIQEQFIQDSIKKADSVMKANRKQSVRPKPANPFVPTPQPVVDYGVVPIEHPKPF